MRHRWEQGYQVMAGSNLRNSLDLDPGCLAAARQRPMFACVPRLTKIASGATGRFTDGRGRSFREGYRETAAESTGMPPGPPEAAWHVSGNRKGSSWLRAV